MRIGSGVSIEELLQSSDRRQHAAIPEMDALEEADALQEADLVDVRFDIGGSSLAMLFDLRTALQFRLANTAVLVVRDVEQVHWVATHESALSRGRVAHYVMSSTPVTGEGGFAFELVCLRGWHLHIAGSSAEFFVGDIPGLAGVPPNFVDDDDRSIADAMPAWGSMFEPGWATFLDPMTP